MSHMGALFLVTNRGPAGIGTVEIGIVDRIVPRPGWSAPFLHRSDDRSEVHVRPLDVEERTNRCTVRKKCNEVITYPCRFVCRAVLEKDGKNAWRLDGEALDRFKSMKWYMSELSARQQRLIEAKKAVKTDVAETKASVDSSVEQLAEDLAKLPSPSRAGAEARTRSPATTP
jgi:hypothetical protein